MERHIRERDTPDDEVIFDHAQFGLLNSQNNENDESSSQRKTESPSSRRNQNKCGNLLRTAALCGAYVSLGLCMAVTGPTLPFLKDQVGVTITEISYIFTARSVGTLGGAFLGGFIMDRFNPYSVFFISIASMGISVGAMPWCKHLWMLMATSIVVGIGNGFLDTGASTLCLQLWGKDSGPYMQTMHFAFAVGGSLAPLLVQAFIAETTAPNATALSSHRHVRSLIQPMNMSQSEETEMLTTAIIKATNQPPAEDRSFSSSSISAISNVSSTVNSTTTTLVQSITTTLAAESTSTTTTTSTTEKPKKPKPQITNGQVLGDSSKFEKIPLLQEPVVDPVPTNATTTTSTSTTIPPDQVKSPENNTSEVSMKPMEAQQTNTTDLPQPTLNGTITSTASSEIGKGSTSEASTNLNQSQNTNPLLTAPSTANEAVVASKPNVTFVTPEVNTNSSNAVAGINAEQSTAKNTEVTQASVSTVPTKAADVVPIPIKALQEEEPTDSQITKSRGKSRGQQDEPIHPETLQTVVVKITTTTTIATPASSPADNVNDVITNHTKDGSNKPNVVVDYLERFGVTRMHMVYTVIAIIVLHTAFAFLFFLCSPRRYSNAAEREADRKVRPFRPRIQLFFVALLFSFYLLYVGAEVVYAQFLTTFGLESQLKLPTSTANYVTTTFWASFAAARFVAILFAHFASPTAMLLFNLGVVTIGALALCIGGQTSIYVLYVASSLIGVGMASTFATGFCWTEQHLLVTNRISASFSVASSMGEMLFPTVIGSLMETSPMALPYSVLTLNVLQIAAFATAWWLARRKGRRSSLNTDNTGYHLARQMDDHQ